MLAAGLIASRFVHFAALLLLFGWSLYPFYVGGTAPRRPLIILAWAAILSGVAWFVFTAAGMAGSLATTADPATLAAVITGTDFGPLWLARLVVLALALASLWRPAASRLPAWAPALAAAIALAGLAGTGHARVTSGLAGALHIGADGLHLLAAGAWLGGLAALAGAMRSGVDAATLRRFSGMGYLAVGALVLTGVVNSWLLVASLPGLVITTYGRWLSLKLALFLAMAGLAAANRFSLTPRLARDPTDGAVVAELRRHVIAEQLLGALVVAIVSLLGTLAPPVSG